MKMVDRDVDRVSEGRMMSSSEASDRKQAKRQGASEARQATNQLLGGGRVGRRWRRWSTATATLLWGRGSEGLAA